MSDDLARIFGHEGQEWKAPTEEEFAQLVSHCLVEGVSTTEIADTLHVSEATVHRWSLKKSTPIFFVRKNMMNRLRLLLEGKQGS